MEQGNFEEAAMLYRADLGLPISFDGTEPTPGLPYIAGLAANAEATFEAVEAAIASLTHADKDALGIQGFVRIAAEDYLSIENPPRHVSEQV